MPSNCLSMLTSFSTSWLNRPRPSVHKIKHCLVFTFHFCTLIQNVRISCLFLCVWRPFTLLILQLVCQYQFQLESVLVFIYHFVYSFFSAGKIWFFFFVQMIFNDKKWQLILFCSPAQFSEKKSYRGKHLLLSKRPSGDLHAIRKNNYLQKKIHHLHTRIECIFWCS